MSLIDAMYDYNLRAGENLNPPKMLTPVVHGTAGSTSHSYRATFVTLVGETTPTEAATVTNGNATLSGNNYITVGIDALIPGALSANIYKLSGGQYKLLGNVVEGALTLNDIGQAVSGSVIAPVANTSGRPRWRAMLWKHGKYLQRQELMDLQWILLRGIKDIADKIHKNGDIIQGLIESKVSGTTWAFSWGYIYYDGQFIPVPNGTVTLTGTGTEEVGLSLESYVRTHLTDPVIRNQDEEVDLTYCQEGADRLEYVVTWVKDTPGQINVRTFLNNAPLLKVERTERTELDKAIERRTNDVSGSFVVRPFSVDIVAHSTDTTKLTAKVGPGKGYPNGVEVETIAVQPIDINKARTTQSRNNDTVGAFSYVGGSVTGTGSQNFNVSGKSIKLKIGYGGSHTVTFNADGMTASQVAAAINASVNAYPTAGASPLVAASAVSGHVKIQAANAFNKWLTFETVSNDAYTILGIATGTYWPSGTRIYEANDAFLKSVSDVNYGCQVVESVVYDGGSGKNLLSNTGVYAILGASNSSVDCYDGKWDYQYGIDFGRDGNYIDFTMFGGANPNPGATFYVKYRYVRNPVKGSRIYARVIDAKVVKGAEDGSDLMVFTDATSIKNHKTNANISITGAARDVVQILSVNNTAGQSTSAYTAMRLTTNTTELAMNQSAISWANAGGQGVTPGGQPTSGQTYYVSFDFWYHAIEGDFIACDSYDTYEFIGLAPDGVTKLRDCLDFRTIGGSGWPIDGEAITLDYEFYLARRDKLALGGDGYFKVITGKPGIVPPSPADQDGLMTVAVLDIAPYTYSTSEVSVIYVDKLRITQLGLKEMMGRLERLEYFQAINNLVNDTASHTAAANAQGFSCDPLTGCGRCDIGYLDANSVKFSAQIDQLERCVRLQTLPTPAILQVDMNASTGVRQVGNSVMLDYEESLYQGQSKATEFMNVNSDLIAETNHGILEISPEHDFFMDTTQLPTINADYDNNVSGVNTVSAEDANDILGTVSWTSRNVSQDVDSNSSQIIRVGGNMTFGVGLGTTTTTTTTTTDTTTSLVPNRRTVDLGNQIVDLSIVPKARTHLPNGDPFYITMTAYDLVENGQYGCTIGGTYVSLIATGSTSQGNSYQSVSTVLADNDGYFTAKFAMPSGMTAGDLPINVFLTSDPSFSQARAVFTSLLLRQTQQNTTLGLTSYSIQQDVNVSTTTTTETNEVVNMSDPLAQTFLVSSGIFYPGCIELFFKSKSANRPVTVDIRKTSNGYPTKDVILSKTLLPASINVSEDGSEGTKFYFDRVVGLLPDEYAIVVMCNSLDYNVWTAKLGGVDIQTQQVCRAQTHDGVLFHSPNNRTWEPLQKQDLTFNLYAANFVNDCQILFHNMTGVQAGALMTAVQEFVGPGATVHWSYSIDGGLNWIAYKPGINTELNSVATQVQLRIDVTSLGGAYQIIDQVAGIVFQVNKLTGDYIGTLAHFTDDLNLPNEVCILVDLDTDVVSGATGIRKIRAYYTLDDLNWVELLHPSNYTPVLTAEPYYEHQFKTPPERSVTGATNANPIMITSANHGYSENAIITISGVGGNTAANGTFRVKTVTDDTFKLYNPTTGAGIPGSGTYTTGGTFSITPFDYCRGRIRLETTNQAMSPKAKNIRVICS
jgi:hypothetical protein